jgi:DNA-directed RNA polymerase subunit RPC12/RpoP
MGPSASFPVWIWLTAAGVVLLGAVALLLWGLLGDRSKGRPRCPKCWYDMTGSVAAGRVACPECGYEALNRKRLYKNRRRWWAVVAGVLLLSPFAYPARLVGGWYREQRLLGHLRGRPVPTGVFISPNWLTVRVPAGWGLFLQRVRALQVYDATDGDIAYIKRLRCLRDLALYGRDVTDEGLAHLSGLADLETLGLGQTSVTDAGLAHLAGLRNLGWSACRRPLSPTLDWSISKA